MSNVQVVEISNSQVSLLELITAGPQGPSGVSLEQVEGLIDAAVTDLTGVTDILHARLDDFRDSNRVYVSPNGNDTNNGTSLGEPLRTLAAAAASAMPGDLVVIGPGTYIEHVLPIRWKRDVGLFCSGLRNTKVKPWPGQEMKGFFKVDSGFWCWGLEFAGHQADSLTGQQSWAISFNELADNRSLGSVGLGAYILKSPYIQNCSSVTAELDSGTAGSVSVGDTGGGILVDGRMCAANSPIRSMVVDSYTQVNLGGPGCLVTNDGYAQLVSFFGTFCEYHVKAFSGGQVNLSGGGTSDFGVYGLIASGYSPKSVFTGLVRDTVFGGLRLERSVSFSQATNKFTAVNHTLLANDLVTFNLTQGSLPLPLTVNTPYFVRADGLTTDTFSISAVKGGPAISLTETTGTYFVVRQGATQVDVVDFTPNRLGRQIKYPSTGSLGSSGQPVLITAVSSSTFTVTLNTSTIKHEYVGGGVLTVNNVDYNILSAVYNNVTGLTTISALGYTPVTGVEATLRELSFICNSSSRPNSGQLIFPQLVFPRNAVTGVAEAKTFNCTKTGANTLTYLEASAATGPDHEYVSGGVVSSSGVNYEVTNASYNKGTGLVTINTATPLPSSIGSTFSATVRDLVFICPTSAYEVTSSVPINLEGNTVPNDSPNRAGYRVFFTSRVNGGLKNTLLPRQVLDFRQRSQITAPGHTFEYVGAGTNYNALPSNGGVPVPANKINESNNGRIYSSNTDELGNFAVGTQFFVDGTTGAVTINADQFNLSGLNFIGPFSRNGGISSVGEQLKEISNNTNLIASTGAPDGNTAPTQFAVKTYTDNRYLADLTVSGFQPISVSDTSVRDSSGYWTRTRNISLTLNAPNGLAQLDSGGLIPAAILPTVTEVEAQAGISAERRVYTAQRVFQSIAAWWLANTSAIGRALSTAVNSASARNTLGLGTAAITDATAYATASQGSLASSAVQPSTLASSLTTKADLVGGVVPRTQLPILGTAAPLDIPVSGNAASNQVVVGTDTRLTDSREWFSPTVSLVDAQAGVSTTRAAFTPQRVFQSIAAWWLVNTGATGRAVTLASTPVQGRAALELGSAALAATGDFATPSALTAGLAGKADLVSGVIPTSQIPSIAVVDFLGRVADQAAMLNLRGQSGDWCIRSDLFTEWVIVSGDGSVIGNWVERPTGISPVNSVNGQKGSIVLGTGDIGESSGNLYLTEARVRNTLLTGYTNSFGAITASDSVLTAIQKLAGNISVAGTGSVTSVSLSLPNLFAVSGSPVTTSGTLTATLAGQLPNTILAGPSTGGSSTPTFRTIVPADLPVATTSDAGSMSSADKIKLNAISGTNTGDQTITLTGEVTGFGTGSFATTLTNSAVIGKVLTGYSSAAGTITATDTILQAIQKLNGNDANFLTTTTAATTYQPLTVNLTALAGNGVAYYLNRANHTGTQAATSITGLSTVATSGAYRDLSGLPTLGTLASQNGTFSGTSSGTNTGDQDLSGKANTGAVTSSGLTMTSGRLLGRSTAGTGSLEELTPLGLTVSGSNLTTLSDLIIPVTDEISTITASTSVAKVTIPYWPRATVLTDLLVWAVGTAPTGASMQFDWKVGGTSIYSTLPTISAGSTNSTSSAGTYSTAFTSGGSTIALGSKVEIYVTQVGTGGGVCLKAMVPTRRGA